MQCTYPKAVAIHPPRRSRPRFSAPELYIRRARASTKASVLPTRLLSSLVPSLARLRLRVDIMDPHHPPPLLLLHSHRQTPQKPTNPAIAPKASYVSHHLTRSRPLITDSASSQTKDGRGNPNRAPSVPSERVLRRREPGGLVNAMPFFHNSGRHSLRCVYPIH